MNTPICFFETHLEQLRRTKIVATLGPASSSPEKILELINAGVNVFRLNFSHGSHEEHLLRLTSVREIARECGKPVAILQDLCGPKLRIGAVVNDSLNLVSGDEIDLLPDTGILGDSQTLYVQAINPGVSLKLGQRILLADGVVELVVNTQEGNCAHCTVSAGGHLRSKSGFVLPGAALDLPPITEKDLLDLAWGVTHSVDFVALSFVQDAEDIHLLRAEMVKRGNAIPIVAKIERSLALENLEEILQATDAVMVARGDLGLELPLEQVPAAQKRIIRKARKFGVPVITATQMMRSMVTEARPTRAEVTDVSTAVRDGSDAVMLSEETAVGQHPVLAVQILHRILRECEKAFPQRERAESPDQRTSIPDAICFAAFNAATKVDASAIIVCTESGITARHMAKYRPGQPVIAATYNYDTYHQLCLSWGISPLLLDVPEDAGPIAEVSGALNKISELYEIRPGTRVVVTVGIRIKEIGSTNELQIHEF